MSTDADNQEYPLILNGKFFKVESANRATGQVTAFCMECQSKQRPSSSGLDSATSSTGTDEATNSKNTKLIHGSIRPTSNFTTHLKKWHADTYQKYQLLMKDPKNKFKNAKQSTLPFERVIIPSVLSKTERLVTDYIVESMSPLSTVDCPSFKALISGLCEGAKVPDRKRLKAVIENRYAKHITSLKDAASKAEYYCVTCDIWSSRHRSFLGMTLHWLDCNLQRKSVVIALKRFKGTHDFEKITDAILDIFAQFELENDKITCVVTDNGSNFVKAFSEYGIVFEDAQIEDSDIDEEEPTFQVIPSSVTLPAHQRCASHTLSLIATTDLDNANIVTARGQGTLNFKRTFRSALAKCTSLWNSVSRSVKNNEEITKLCGKQLIRPNATRWNSFFDSIRRLIEFKAFFMEIFKIVGVENLTSTEVQYLEEYLYSMEPVAYALDKLQVEKSLYYGYLAPVILRTKKSLEKIQNENKPFASPIAKVLKEGIDTRFASIALLNFSECQAAICAAICHPYFKLRWIPTEKQEDIKGEFIANAKTFASHPSSRIANLQQMESNRTTTKDDKFFSFEEASLQPQREMADQIELECLKYLRDPCQEISCLEFYPTIRKMFVKYNTSLISSAPVERAFSYGGLIFSPKRNRLSDEMLNALVILKVNFNAND